MQTETKCKIFCLLLNAVVQIKTTKRDDYSRLGCSVPVVGSSPLLGEGAVVNPSWVEPLELPAESKIFSK